MNSFELNKILGAVLGTCLVLLSLNITAGALFSTPPVEKPGFAIAVKEEPAGGGQQQQQQVQPIETLLASASVEKGQAVVKQCAACHTFEKGGPNRVGPNLFGIVGANKAHLPNFNYSAAMKAKGGDWSLEELNQFLANPRGFVPGTNMTFAGLRDSQRADVIAYLNSLADSPKPLPTAQAPAQGGGQQPAQGGQGAQGGGQPPAQGGQGGQAPQGGQQQR
jgi:cytochrome c